jgi:hypothetical protein
VFSTVLLFREALYGALVIALACSVLGVYVVLRRIVFVGAALAQISSAGIAFALWLAGAGIALGPLGLQTVLSLLLTLIAVMVLRRTRPDAPRPYRAFGYPVTPLVCATVVTGYLLTLLTEPTALVRTLLGLAIVATGIPFYARFPGANAR